MFEALVQLLVAVGLTFGGYGFARAARHLLRHPEWWLPESALNDLLLMIFLTPTYAGRALLRLGKPGRAATFLEAGMAAFVSFGLFTATGAVLALG